MREWIYDCWNHIMDAEINPLRHIPDLNVRHMIMQVLAFMWSAVFSIAIADSICLLYTSPSPRDVEDSRMPSSA